MTALLPIRWLRRLIWTLVLALPLQALAMVSGSACARMPAPGSSATQAQHEHAQHHGHHAQQQLDVQSGHATPSDLNHPHGDQPCSACAAACVATALLGTAPALAVVSSQTPLIALDEPASLHIVPIPLDRPPRLSRA